MTKKIFGQIQSNEELDLLTSQDSEKLNHININNDIDLDEIKSDLETVKNNYGNSNIDDLKTEVDGKINIVDIIDNLNSVDKNKPLSAKQGKELKKLIDDLNTLINSNDTNLDTIQEIVNYIKVNRQDLESLNIDAIVGLRTLLNDLQSQITDIKDKTDKITVTGNVNLDTISSDVTANKNNVVLIKNKTDKINISGEVNLDTIKNDVNTNKSNINSIKSKTDNITVNGSVDLNDISNQVTLLSNNTGKITSNKIDGLIEGDLISFNGEIKIPDILIDDELSGNLDFRTSSGDYTFIPICPGCYIKKKTEDDHDTEYSIIYKNGNNIYSKRYRSRGSHDYFYGDICNHGTRYKNYVFSTVYYKDSSGSLGFIRVDMKTGEAIEKTINHNFGHVRSIVSICAVGDNKLLISHDANYGLFDFDGNKIGNIYKANDDIKFAFTGGTGTGFIVCGESIKNLTINGDNINIGTSLHNSFVIYNTERFKTFYGFNNIFASISSRQLSLYKIEGGKVVKIYSGSNTCDINYLGNNIYDIYNSRGKKIRYSGEKKLFTSEIFGKESSIYITLCGLMGNCFLYEIGNDDIREFFYTKQKDIHGICTNNSGSNTEITLSGKVTINNKNNSLIKKYDSDRNLLFLGGNNYYIK